MSKKKHKIDFKIYTPEEYDKIVEDLLKIPNYWNPKRIINYIAKKFSLTVIPGQLLSEETSNNFPFYRIRVYNKGQSEIDESNPKSFGYPPKSLMPFGRANRKGMQVLYGSSDDHTPFIEKKNDIIPGKSIIYLTKWGIKPYPGPVIYRSLFLGLPIDNDSYTAIMAKPVHDHMKEQFKNLPEKAWEYFLYGQKKYNDLFCAEGEEYYPITSAMIYDTFVLAAKQNVHIPIVMYPSVAKKRDSVNFVIRKDFVDKYMYVKEVKKIIVKEIKNETIEASLTARATNVDGKLVWKSIRASLNDIGYSYAKVMYNGKEETIRDLKPEDKITTCCKEHGISLKEFFQKNNISEHEIMSQLNSTNLGEINKELPLRVRSSFIAPTYGNVYLTDNVNEDAKISHILVPFTYTLSYQ
jgi:hypothetical protein